MAAGLLWSDDTLSMTGMDHIASGLLDFLHCSFKLTLQVTQKLVLSPSFFFL